jgi:PAS domain S-box-containing protein
MANGDVVSSTVRKAPALHVWILVLGVAATLGLSGWSHFLHVGQMESELHAAGQQFARELEGRVQSYIDTLPGLRAFALLNPSPDDREFQRYVQAISLQERFPGLALTFLIQRVRAAERDAFVQGVRRDRSVYPEGRPTFSIQPPGEREDYLVLRHTYPEDPGGLGYDLLDTSQTYRAAALRTAETGKVVATGPLRLARDRDRASDPSLTSVVVRVPIYQSEEPPDSAAQRWAQLQALAGVSFNTVQLVQSSLPEFFRRERVRVQIIDARAEQDAAPAVVYDSLWETSEGSGGRLPAHQTDHLQDITIADRTWRISFDAHPQWAVSDVSLPTWILLVAGFGLTALGWLAARAQFEARNAAERGFEQARRDLAIEQEHLLVSEGRYRSLFENSMEGILQTRPTGQVLAANPAACALLRRTEKDICQLGREGLLDLDDPRAHELIRVRASTGSAQGVLRFKRGDGSSFEAEVASRIYRDHDGEVAANIFFRDVTERQELLARQSRLIAIVEATPDLVVTFDMERRVVFMNASARRRAGVPDHQDPAGLPFDGLHQGEADLRRFEEAMSQAIRCGSWSGQMTVRASAQGGEGEPALVVLLSHQTPSGGVAYLSWVARSLKEVLRMQQERDQIEGMLHQSQKLEALGTLAGGIAHDFNNVLAAIIGNASLVQDSVSPNHPVSERAALILKAALRARGLVQQILTFSRRGTASRTAQPLQPLLQEAAALLKSTLPPSVALAMELMPEPVSVLADPSQIHQVVMNLCTNAWQALPAGKGHVWLRLFPSPAAGSVRLEVEDDGLGMDDATQRRIFEPFFTTKQVGQGTGLGLSVVHGIVAHMGGSIKVRSHPGAGTCFQIDLPVAASDRTSAASEDPVVERGRGETILYVDDDEVVALTLEALMARLGYHPVRCAQGQEALGLLAQDPGRYAALLTDYNMPGMNGLEVAQMARALSPDIPVLMMSGYVTDELRWQAAATGVAVVLLKEHCLEQLGHELRRALSDAAALRPTPVVG